MLVVPSWRCDPVRAGPLQIRMKLDHWTALTDNELHLLPN